MRFTKALLLALSFVITVSLISGCKNKETLNSNGINESVTENNNQIFDLRLYSDKQTYKSTDKIKVWATLEYIGNSNEVKIWHGIPYMVFSITDGKDFNVNGLVNTILTSTVLKKGKVYRFDYAKSGGFDGDDPKAEFWKKFYEEKDLYLPVGEYSIKVGCAFTLSEDQKENKFTEKSKEIKVKVVK